MIKAYIFRLETIQNDSRYKAIDSVCYNAIKMLQNMRKIHIRFLYLSLG